MPSQALEICLFCLFSQALLMKIRSSGATKNRYFWCSDWPKLVIWFALIACNFEICAAHRRSLLLQQAAAAPDVAGPAARSTRVFWWLAFTERSKSSSTGQPGTRRHISHVK